MFQTKVAEKLKTHILCSIFCLSNRFFYEKMWKNIVERGRPQMTIWRMRIACWIPKTNNTHTECVIHIAFPPEQWFHARALTLRHTYFACLVLFLFALFLHIFSYFVLNLDVLLPSSVLLFSFHFRSRIAQSV